MSRTQRLFQIAALLSEEELTVSDLAVRLMPGQGQAHPDLAARRAIQRDLNELQLLEPTLERTSTRPPRYRIPTPRNSLHPTEALMLHTAARALYHASSGEQAHHRAVLARLNTWLPDHLRPVLERSFADVGQRRERSREPQNLEKVASAWLGAHPLHFQYQKPGGSGTWRDNTVHPYLIELNPHNLELYLIGLETTFHHDIRTFKLSRMRHLDVARDQHYTIPPTFDPRTFLQSAWGVVGTQGHEHITLHLRFRQDAAYRILEGGHANLDDITRLPDGQVEATVRAATDSSGLPREVFAWIYSFGPRVQILSPAHIRQHWLNELQEAIAIATENDATS